MSKPLWYPGNGDAYIPPRGSIPPPTSGYNNASGGYNPPPSGFYLPANQGYNGQPAFTQQISQPQKAPLNSGRGTVSTYPPFRQLVANDWVKVQLETRGWVLGVVIAVLKAADALTNWGYTVRYRPPNAQMYQERNFTADRVQPTD